MTSKLTRKDLRRNELADTVGKTVGYVQTHRRGATESLVAVAVLVLAVGGFFLYRSWREEQAGRAMSEGLEVLAAPLASEPGASAAARSFPTAAERETEAQKHFREAAEKSGTRSGRAAALILAARSDKPAEAEKAVLEIASRGRDEIAAAAEIDVARLLIAQGKTTEAIDRLKRAVESSSSGAPKDALLFALGEAYVRGGLAVEAKAAFERLTTEYPSSPYRPEAQRLSGQ